MTAIVLIHVSIAGMQTLGLSDTPHRSEGRLKSLFWPSIENAWDVDYLRQQGFWLCFVVAVVSAISLTVGHQWLLALLAGGFYLFGACGVREGSFAAAFAVLLAYLLDTIGAPWLAPAPGVVRILALSLLLANVRATYLASHWAPVNEVSEKPMRFDDSWQDKLADRMPAILWPRLRILFVVLAVVYCALATLGAGYSIALRSGILKSPTVQSRPRSATVVVAPPDGQ